MSEREQGFDRRRIRSRTIAEEDILSRSPSANIVVIKLMIRLRAYLDVCSFAGLGRSEPKVRRRENIGQSPTKGSWAIQCPGLYTIQNPMTTECLRESGWQLP